MLESIRKWRNADNVHHTDPLYEVRSYEFVPTHEQYGYDQAVVISPDCEEECEFIASEMRESLVEGFDVDPDEVDGLNEDQLLAKMNQLSGNDDDYTVHYAKKTVIANIRASGNFYTREACQLHIDANHYHYGEPFTYGNTCWRNPEQETILDVIMNSELVGAKD